MAMRANGRTYEDFVDALAHRSDLAGWVEEKGARENARELKRAWTGSDNYLPRNDADVFGDLDRFRIANMTQGEPPELRFLLDGLMPLGTLGLVYGPGGVGKSLVAMDLCLEVANLTPANDNARPHAILGSTVPTYARGASIFLTLEDDEAEVHRRTTSLDPDRTRRNGPCYVITASSLPDFDPALVTMKDRAAVLTKLAQEELPNLLDRTAKDAGCPVRLLVLDPAGDFINGDENDAAPVKLLMRSLRTLSAKFGTTTILLGHVPKASSGGQPTMRGSSAWMANARFAYSLHPKSGAGAKSGEAKGNTAASKGKAGTLRLIEGCLTKANHAGAPIDQTTVFRRDERGRLVRATSDALGGKAEPTDDDLVAMLAQQCAAYAEAGMPFAYSGKNGLWEGRTDLDKPLSGLAKNRLEGIGNLALDSGALVKVKTPTSTKATYLDVPDGALTHGVVVDLPSGSRRRALREREKAADGQEVA